jgi:NAD(P)-dependent dehydrogenase (short-subunit alcohol dehydrogenase family)
VSSERDIAGERIVVTGATDGIGKEIARALISRGALLTLIARDAGKAAATAAELAAQRGAAETPAIVMCDLADLSSVRAAAQELHERYDGVDVLVANAGMRSFEPHTTTDGFEQMMATNHLGPFLLTNLLLDLLRATAPSRIVITASEAHRLGGRVDLDHLAEPAQFSARAAEGFYGRSKLMNLLFTQELARRLEGSGVTANCFCPGAVATGLVRDSRLVTLAAGALSRTPLIRRPDQGARMGIRLVLDPALADVSGSFFTSTPGLRFLPQTAARKDVEFQRRAWDRSAELVGL